MQYHLPFDIKAVGENIKWGRGERELKFEEKNSSHLKKVGEEYKVVGNIIPLLGKKLLKLCGDFCISCLVCHHGR